MERKRKLIIYDLDDTLIDTSDLYWKIKKSFLSLNEFKAVDCHFLERLFENTDTTNMRKFGYSPLRYGITMQDVYMKLVDNKYLETNALLETKIKEIGKRLLYEFPELIPKAIEIITITRKFGIQVLLTRGEQELQNKKIKHHSLQNYFDEIIISNNKTVQDFQEIISNYSIPSRDTWIIGDSIKSDINPGIKAGANCIHYKYEHEEYFWEQEHNETPSGHYFEITELNKIPGIIEADNE